MPRGALIAVSTLGAAALSWLYWASVALLADRTSLGPVEAATGGTLLFAGLIAGWRKVEACLVGLADQGRALTPGERDAAMALFGQALALDRVRIHGRRYLPWQAAGVAMTPDGEVWFDRADHQPDFSLAVPDWAWLAHELTHAWQHQIGRSVLWRGVWEQAGRLFGRDPYPYGAIDPARAYAGYGNEQQAAMVEDYVRLSHGLAPRYGSGTLDEYRRAIPFLA